MTAVPLSEYKGRVLISDPEFRVVVLGDDLRDPEKCLTVFWGLHLMPEAHSWVLASIDPCATGKIKDLLSWSTMEEPSGAYSGYVASARNQKPKPLEAIATTPVTPMELDCNVIPKEGTVPEPPSAFQEWLSVTVKLINSLFIVRGK